MKTHGLGRFAFLVLGSLTLAGCAVGTAFMRPAVDAFELGRTTFPQIVELLGKPNEEEPMRKNSVDLRMAAYIYMGDAEPVRVANAQGARRIEFWFSGDVLVNETFVSSFASDSTDFDERRFSDIVKGKTRCDEVVQMLGRPSARGIYPALDKDGDRGIGYLFAYVKRPLLQFKMYQKGLYVVCDPAGVVTESSYSEAGDR